MVGIENIPWYLINVFAIKACMDFKGHLNGFHKAYFGGYFKAKKCCNLRNFWEWQVCEFFREAGKARNLIFSESDFSNFEGFYIDIS